MRWNHTLQQYTQIDIDEDGSASVFTAKSLDPFNATWRPTFPPGSGMYPYTMTSDGTTFTATGRYKDLKTGKVLTFKGICTKGK